MKQFFTTVLVIGLAVPGLVFAETLPSPVDEDLYYSDEVFIGDVDPPSDLTATTGTSSALLEGVGTVTVGSRSGGGFPRITIFGGTMIDSSRTWGSGDQKTWWEGDISAPMSVRGPQISDISFKSPNNHPSSELYLSETYGWGLENETFIYSPSALAILPVGEMDMTKIWLAYKQDDDSWKIGENDFCVVLDGLCSFEVESVSEVALTKEFFSRCPTSEVAHGTVGSEPECRVTCDRGYTLSEDVTECVGDDYVDFEPPETQLSAPEADLREEIIVRPGYFRYQDARGQFLVVDTSGLEGEDLVRAQRMNANAAFRLRDVPEDGALIAGADKDAGFMDYLFRMRNWFGEKASSNVYRSGEGLGSEVEVIEGEEVVDTSGETGTSLVSSAPILPRTGPGIFLGLAALGLGVMVFGRRRR